MLAFNVVMDITNLYPRIWIGSAPKTGRGLADAGFHTLVLCAEEYQPPFEMFPGLDCVIHAPMTDDESPENCSLAVLAAEAVKREWERGRTILITCHLGRNRSALVTALAIFRVSGMSMRYIIAHVRRLRKDRYGVRALANPHFMRFLRSIEDGDAS